MQNMSSESIWRAAPHSVRQTPALHEVNSNQIGRQTANKEARTPAAAKRATQPKEGQANFHPPLPPYLRNNSKTKIQKQYLPSDKATPVCTTQSPLTRNTQTQSNTVTALEETIQRQQQEIRNMLLRFDAMDTKMEHLAIAIKSGETNQNSTILQIQKQLDKVCTSLNFLVQQTTATQSQQPSPPQIQRHHELTPISVAIQEQNGHSGAFHTIQHHQHTERSNGVDSAMTEAKVTQQLTTRPRLPLGKSPEKKKQRSTTPISNNHYSRPQSPADHSRQSRILDGKSDKTRTNTDQSGAQ